MLIRKLSECDDIVAGDGTRLRELLHPEREYPFGGRYSLAWALLEPQSVSRKHRLDCSEVYYILSGTGEMHINDEIALVEAGDAIDIPPGSVQWIRNIGSTDLIFLCIVDPAWTAENDTALE